MAFFGLTALGPQDVFTHHSKTFVNIYIFELEDFESSWTTFYQLDSQISKPDLNKILRKLYRGTVPKNDSNLILNQFGDDEIIEYSRYIDVLLNLKEVTAAHGGKSGSS
jgi:hypothetical protein